MDQKITITFMTMTFMMGLAGLDANVNGSDVITGWARFILFAFIVFDKMIFYHTECLFTNDNRRKYLKSTSFHIRGANIFVLTCYMTCVVLSAKYLYMPWLFFLFFMIAGIFAVLWWFNINDRLRFMGSEDTFQKLVIRFIIWQFLVIAFSGGAASLLFFKNMHVYLKNVEGISILTISILTLINLYFLWTSLDLFSKLCHPATDNPALRTGGPTCGT